MKLGLRIDVDTYRGTRRGVPALCRILQQHSARATFFFSVGPDNMGRHLWRLLRPDFLRKMLRTRAASLYGWDILLRGTFWPGPVIGKYAKQEIRAARDAGHEIGLHAWDHHAWQTQLDSLSPSGVQRELERGFRRLKKILGQPPVCSAAPAWKCNETVLRGKKYYKFEYNSDCRGESIFRPVIDGVPQAQPQIPVTLPTYDEMIGRNGITDENYNEYLIAQLRPGALHVLTIHAEVEGIVCQQLFVQFLQKARAAGIECVPLGELLADAPQLELGRIVAQAIPGREGWAAWQAPLPAL